MIGRVKMFEDIGSGSMLSM